MSLSEAKQIDGDLVVTDETLGVGTSAKVVKAYRGNEVYALKIFNTVANAEQQEDLVGRIRFEAALVQQIRHPNVVKIYSVEKLASGDAMVMEMLEQPSLGKLLKTQKLSYDAILLMALQLTDALRAIHAKRIVHRDLQPSNILFDPQTKKTTIIDFGLAIDAGRMFNNQIVGTALYIPPEQTGGIHRDVDGRSDLYTLGAVLFHCIAGVPPLVGDTTLETINKQIREEPAKLGKIVPGVPKRLEALVYKLMRKDPDDRPGSADDVLQELKTICGEMGIVVSADDFPEESLVRPFIGRKAELEELYRLWGKARTGSSSMGLVSGAPGLGKSSLLSMLSAKCRNEGATILYGKCAHEVPLGVIRQLLQDLIEQMKGNAEYRDLIEEPLRGLLENHEVAVARVCPELLRYFNIKAKKPSLDLDQKQFYGGIAELLCCLSLRQHPLVLVVDDIQWLDEASRGILGSCIDFNHGCHHLLIVASSRNDSASEDMRLRFVNFMGRRLSADCQLSRLTLPETRELTQSIIGSHLELPEEALETIYYATSGNAFGIEEYVRHLLFHGIFAPNWSAWDFNQNALARLGLPTNIIELVDRRIAELDATTRDILAAGAVIGSSFDLDELQSVVHIEIPLIRVCIAKATRLGFLKKESALRYKFAHDRIREASLLKREPELIRTFHQNLADRISGGEFDPVKYADHLWQGSWTDPNMIYDACVLAAREAAVHHNTDIAYVFFQRAEEVAKKLNVGITSIQEEFGEVCKKNGQKIEAKKRFLAAIPHAADPYDRARIYGKIARNDIENLETKSGFEMTQKAFKEIGWSFPSFKRHFLPGIINAIIGNLIYLTKKGYGTARGKRARRYEVLVELHELAGFLRFFEIDPLTGVVASARMFVYSHRLGDSAALVRLCSMLCTILGVFKARRLLETLYVRNVNIAQRLGDPQLIAHAKAFRAFGISYTGAELEAEEYTLDLLNDYKNTLSAENLVYLCGVYMSSTLLRGFPQDTLQIATMSINLLEQSNTSEIKLQEHYLTWSHSYAMAALIMLGRLTEAQVHKDKLDAYFSQHPDDRYHWGIHLNNLAQIYVEQGDIAESSEALFQRHDKLNLFIPLAIMHIRHFYIAKAWIRLNRFKASTKDNMPVRRRSLTRALWQLRLSCDTDLFRGHYHAIMAEYWRVLGKHKKCRKSLRKADVAAESTNNEVVRYEALLTRARLAAADCNKQSSISYAQAACGIALRHGWKLRIERLEKEFKLDSNLGKGSVQSYFSKTEHGRSRSSTVTNSLTFDKDYVDALIRISLAASQSLDPINQAKTALAEVLTVFGAERAGLFLAEGEAGERQLKFAVGRDAEGGTFFEFVNYSYSAVDKAWRNQKAFVFGISEDEGNAESQSMVLHDIRSIMVAPVVVKGKDIGLLYVDTTLAKGMFGEQNVRLLEAIGVQIGIAIENARSSRIEIEKKSLEQDIALTGYVQRMLIPKQKRFATNNVKLSISYNPAAVAGGDWVWYEQTQEGGLVAVLADVSGHGPGPAIMTGLAAGAYMAAWNQLRQRHGDIMNTLQDIILRLTAGDVMMTFAIVEVCPQKNELLIYNAGSPCFCLFDSSRNHFERLALPSSLLGVDKFSLNFKQVPFPPGSRLMVATDGAFEFPYQDRQFGTRRLLRLFEKACTSSNDINEILNMTQEEIERMASSGIDDDMTILLVENCAT